VLSTKPRVDQDRKADVVDSCFRLGVRSVVTAVLLLLLFINNSVSSWYYYPLKIGAK